MADNARDSNDLEKRRTDEAALSARLRRLGDRLGQQRPDEAPPPYPPPHAGEGREGAGRGPAAAAASGYARGFRLSSELVGGVLVGAAIGWALDRVLGISPWGLIVFLLLGFVAGVVSVVRSAGVAPPPSPHAGDGREGDGRPGSGRRP
jgi:ATP synthase protein I